MFSYLQHSASPLQKLGVAIIVAWVWSASSVFAGEFQVSLLNAKSISWSDSSHRIAAYAEDGVFVFDASLAPAGAISRSLNAIGLPKVSPSVSFCTTRAPRHVEVWDWDLATSRSVTLPAGLHCDECAITVADVAESNSLVLGGLGSAGQPALWQIDGVTGAVRKRICDAQYDTILRRSLVPGSLGVLSRRISLAKRSFFNEIVCWPGPAPGDHPHKLTIREEIGNHIYDWDIAPDGSGYCFGAGGRIFVPTVGELSFPSKAWILQQPTGAEVPTVFTKYPFGSDPVLSVSWSPDGTSIAMSSLSSIVILSGVDFSESRRITTHAPANLLAYSPDGSRLAGYSFAAATLTVWLLQP